MPRAIVRLAQLPVWMIQRGNCIRKQSYAYRALWLARARVGYCRQAVTADDLLAMIAQGESLALEFKSDTPDGVGLHDMELAEAVVCLANTHGGIVLVGVEDDG